MTKRAYTFTSTVPCGTCGGVERYHGSNACRACNVGRLRKNKSVAPVAVEKTKKTPSIFLDKFLAGKL